MIRTLLIVSAAAFVASLATLSGAVAIVGPAAVANGALSFGPGGWRTGGWSTGGWRFGIGRGDADRDDGSSMTKHHDRWTAETKAESTRELDWTGGDSLDIDLPAEVHFVQAEGAGKITISGPQDGVKAVVVENGKIRFDHDIDLDTPVVIKITAPAVKHFTLESSGSLAVDGFRQDSLGLTIDGSGDVHVQGDASDLKLDISGSGNADLSALKVKTAHLGIEGSGGARVGPSDAADVEISGSGVARLLTRPARLQSRVSGSGRVVEAEPQ
jgi:hypothetical protein